MNIEFSYESVRARHRHYGDPRYSSSSYWDGTKEWADWESKSLGTSLLRASFFTAPLIFGQIFPRLSTFTATHSVGTRDIRRLDTSKRELDALYLPIRSLIVPPSLFDYLATARLCFLQPYVFPTSHEQSGSQEEGTSRGVTIILCDLPFALICIC